MDRWININKERKERYRYMKKEIDKWMVGWKDGRMHTYVHTYLHTYIYSYIYIYF